MERKTKATTVRLHAFSFSVLSPGVSSPVHTLGKLGVLMSRHAKNREAFFMSSAVMLRCNNTAGELALWAGLQSLSS